MSTTSLRRWLGSQNLENPAGQATFDVGGQTVTVSLCSFADAAALARLIDHAGKSAREAALASFSGYVRGALNQLDVKV